MFVRPGFERQLVYAVSGIRDGPLVFFGQVPQTPVVIEMGVPRHSPISFTPLKFSYQKGGSAVFTQLKTFQVDDHTNGIHGASVS